MNKRQTDALARVEKWATDKAEHETKAGQADKLLREAMKKAVELGVSSTEVARVAGVTRGRVSQVAPREKPVRTPVHAQKKTPEPVRVTSADTVPTLPAPEVGTLAGFVSTRSRRPYGKTTIFYDVATGRAANETGQVIHPGEADRVAAVGSVAHVLAVVGLFGTMLRANVGRVYLTGPLPLDTSSGATTAEQVRAWALTAPPEGWSVAGAGHWLKEADKPLLRFVDDAGRQVTIMRAAMWWGETAADVQTCATAWAGLGKVLDSIPAFRGAGLADTPATTGRALWRRTIPEGKSFPVLSDEYRQLIHSTSGQGRAELLPGPYAAGGDGRRVPRGGLDFTVMDGRLMYAALTWGMPVGEPRRWTGDELDKLDAAAWQKLVRGRGRWRITVTVPAGWNHVGLFMAPAEGGRDWCYPNQPGQTFTTWADGCELWNGYQHGWEATIHEGLSWAEGKPLDAWRDGLVKAWESCRKSESPAAALAARAVRSIILFAIGAFATRAHNVSGNVSADTPELVPDDVVRGSVRQVGDQLVYELPGKLDAWAAETAHPEWSATVWARARARLLDGTGVDRQPVGALHLPPERVIAFATDALYLAGGEPGWADDGKPGRFRVKGTKPGAFAWPTSTAELHKLRDEAEGTK